jgi:hypothetical protein
MSTEVTSLDSIFDKTESIQDKAKDVDERRKNSGKGVPWLFLEEGDEALVRFLHRDPVLYYSHRVWDPDKSEGKGGYVNLTCTKAAGRCPLCEVGEKRSYKGAYLVLHINNTGDGDKVVPMVKMLIRGINDLRMLEAKSKKFDLTKVNLEVSRVGSSTDSRLILDRSEDTTMPEFDRTPIDGASNEEQYVAFLKKKLKPDMKKMEAIAGTKRGSSKGSNSQESDKKSQTNTSTESDDDDDIPF